LLPAAAQACAVCGANSVDRSAGAFIGITALLSLLPVGMIGAGLWWTRRNLWSSLAGDATDRTPADDGAPPSASTRGPSAGDRRE